MSLDYNRAGSYSIVGLKIRSGRLSSRIGGPGPEHFLLKARSEVKFLITWKRPDDNLLDR